MIWKMKWFEKSFAKFTFIFFLFLLFMFYAYYEKENGKSSQSTKNLMWWERLKINKVKGREVEIKDKTGKQFSRDEQM